MTTTVDSSGKVGEYTSIALDSSGKVHISYYDYTNADLKYATNASGAWVTTTVDSSGQVGRYTSIALDSSGKAHISYFDNTNRDLKYATNASGSWVASTVDNSENVGSHTSIALDSSGNVYISYYAYQEDSRHDGDCKYATNVSGSWVATTVDSSGQVGEYTSIALDSSGKAHISYLDDTNYGLKYATNASGSWVATTVDSGTYYVGEYTSIALDSSGKAHISYYDATTTKEYEPKRDLKYATNASGAWVTTTVDGSERVGEYTSIALDSSGKAHISYFDDTNDDLKYATNASGAWVTTTVDSSGEVGEYTSIALDSSGKVHISYYGGYGGGLKYATNASGSWVATTVDSGTYYVGKYTSIALDSSGKAHISYYDATSYAPPKQDLKYATNASGAWVTTTVDGSGEVGEYTSIALDSSGKVHISYYDYTSGDLKYAYGTADVAPTPSPTPTPKTSSTPTLSPSPTPTGCSASSITAFPVSLAIKKSKRYKNAITVWVMGEGGCLVPNAKVKAKLDPAGKKILTVKPSSRKTDQSVSPLFPSRPRVKQALPQLPSVLKALQFQLVQAWWLRSERKWRGTCFWESFLFSLNRKWSCRSKIYFSLLTMLFLV